MTGDSSEPRPPRPDRDRARLARAVLQIMGRATPDDLTAAPTGDRDDGTPSGGAGSNPPVEPALLQRAVRELQRELETRAEAATSGPRRAPGGQPPAAAGAEGARAGARQPVPAPIPGAGGHEGVPDRPSSGHRTPRSGPERREPRRPVNLADEHPLAIAQALAGRPAAEIGLVLARLEPRKSRAVALYLVRAGSRAEPAATENA